MCSVRCSILYMDRLGQLIWVCVHVAASDHIKSIEESTIEKDGQNSIAKCNLLLNSNECLLL